MSSNTFGLLVSLATTGLYGYSMYYLNTPKVLNGFDHVLPEYKAYGQFKYLTVHCLLMQMASSMLHVLAHFVPALRDLRDLVFTALAFPVGSVVVYSFWLVWLGFGREFIFPNGLDAIVPPLCNHTIHTIIAPVNIILAVAVHHKHSKHAKLLLYGYTSSYMVFLHLFKAQTGLYIYPYMDKLSGIERVLYFSGTSVFTHSMFRFGQFITNLVHGSGKTTPSAKSEESPSKGLKQM